MSWEEGGPHACETDEASSATPMPGAGVVGRWLMLDWVEGDDLRAAVEQGPLGDRAS